MSDRLGLVEAIRTLLSMMIEYIILPLMLKP